MTKMSTIYSRLSYGTGTALTGCGVSAKAYAGAVKAEVWILADKIAGMTLSDWAI
ncbi:TPA: holin, partial [Klebsiella pneumoniae]